MPFEQQCAHVIPLSEWGYAWSGTGKNSDEMQSN